MKKIILLLMFTLCVGISARAQPPKYIDDAIQGTAIDQHNYVETGWVHNSTTPGFLKNTLSFSNVPGDYFTFTFEGVQIRWHTETKHWHGIVALSIDGGAETFIDLYSATTRHLTV